jgi:hypothetical protein
MTIKKSYVMLLSAATLTTAAVAGGAYPYHAGDWRNGAIEGLATLWGATNGSGLVHGVSNAGKMARFSNIVIGDVDFSFLWSSAAMRTLGTLPAVTFSQANGMSNTRRIAGPASSIGSGPILASLPGNGAMRYLAGTVGYIYGVSNPPLLSAGTITDPTRPAYGGGLSPNSGNNNQTGGGDHSGPAQSPTPLPAALPLLGSGLACLEILRRIRKN